MDHLWSPWRYRYVTNSLPDEGCLFCRVIAADDDRGHYILHRGEKNFVMLNRYPYSAGHLLIAPYAHIGTLAEADSETLAELAWLTQQAEGGLRAEYKAPGFNIGMNVGAAAGAGVAGHIHMHVLPRWPGDVNFMTAVGETRVLPEDLVTSFERLRHAFRT